MGNNFFDFNQLKAEDAKILNPQVLAFVGDGVYSLYIRHFLSISHNVKSGELHKLTTQFVKATAQSDLANKLVEILNDTELDIYKRARNYKTQSVAKNSSVAEYHRATGFEAVLGYLYLSGMYDRLNEILKFCTEKNNES